MKSIERRPAMHASLPILTAALIAPAIAAAALPDYRRHGDVSWVCAGVGSDERRALAPLRSRADVEILFVTARRGAYLAGVDWTLRGDDGVAILRAMAEGPYCFVDAPPGRYSVEARLGGATRTARANIAREGGKATRVVVAFPDEPWDGVEASPEEKAQAAAP
jgi:hypothetical protein